MLISNGTVTVDFTIDEFKQLHKFISRTIGNTEDDTKAAYELWLKMKEYFSEVGK